MTLDRRTVIVTGATGNLGRALVAAFAARDASLVLVGRERSSLARVFGDEDERRMFMAADLVEPREVEAGVAAAVGRFGRIDALCNVAGGFRMGPRVHETGDEAMGAMFDLNVRTMLNAVRAVVPHMLAAGSGRIVNVGAASGLTGKAGMGAYCAAKSVVHRLTESMDAELVIHGINVNCVLPTTLDTPENRAAMPTADRSRWVAPAELADVIVFLASDAAHALHGALVPVGRPS